MGNKSKSAALLPRIGSATKEQPSATATTGPTVVPAEDDLTAAIRNVAASKQTMGAMAAAAAAAANSTPNMSGSGLFYQTSGNPNLSGTGGNGPRPAIHHSDQKMAPSSSSTKVYQSKVAQQQQQSALPTINMSSIGAQLTSTPFSTTVTAGADAVNDSN
jgi:hypothetical protein